MDEWPTPRLLLPGLRAGECLADYQRRGGYAADSWTLPPAALRDLVAASGLQGRGGSAFPAGTKWQSVAAQPGRHALLVNGAETEPASRKDAVLLTLRPHLVIEGALLAARAVGADACVFYLRAGPARRAVEGALRDVRSLGRPLPRWRIVEAPAGYVAGEESAAIQRCNGKAAKPTFKPPLPYERGVDGRPTLVQNVETLANVPWIVRRGAAAFRAVGTPDAPGTMLVTLGGDIGRPGVYEVPLGAPLGEVIRTLGRGTASGAPVQAVLPGGCFAGWIGRAALDAGVRLERASLHQHGATLGAGAITVVSEAVCGLAQAAALLRFFADQSVRQCGPCTHGTDAMAAVLERVARGRAAMDDLDRLRRYADVMLPRRGACGHLDGATIAARTALTVFADEIARHARSGRCGRPWRVVLPGLEDTDARRSA